MEAWAGINLHNVMLYDCIEVATFIFKKVAIKITGGFKSSTGDDMTNTLSHESLVNFCGCI